MSRLRFFIRFSWWVAWLNLLPGCSTMPTEHLNVSSEQATPTMCEEPTGDHTYTASCISMGSRQPDTPIRDVPSSAQVITRPLIDDQRALTVGDALRNVSGVQGGGR